MTTCMIYHFIILFNVEMDPSSLFQKKLEERSPSWYMLTGKESIQNEFLSVQSCLAASRLGMLAGESPQKTI